jgi:hypothetical protein
MLNGFQKRQSYIRLQIFFCNLCLSGFQTNSASLCNSAVFFYMPSNQSIAFVWFLHIMPRWLFCFIKCNFTRDLVSKAPAVGVARLVRLRMMHHDQNDDRRYELFQGITYIANSANSRKHGSGRRRKRQGPCLAVRANPNALPPKKTRMQRILDYEYKSLAEWHGRNVVPDSAVVE